MKSYLKKVVKKAARMLIPAGKVPVVRHNIPTESVILAEQRSVDPNEPNNKIKSQNINKMVNEHRYKMVKPPK